MHSIRSRSSLVERHCANKFPLTQRTIVAAVRFANAAWESTSPTLERDQDLFQAYLAQRLAIAEQVRSGKISLAAGEAISKAFSEAQRRKDDKFTQRVFKIRLFPGQNE